MGLLDDLGFDNLASEGRYTGSALSDVIQFAGAPVTARAKEHARTYVKGYTFKQILKEDAEKKSRMTYNSRTVAWPLVYYKT
jgi:hypothetical protein